MLITISIAAFLFTFLGGLFTLKFKDKLHLILGFSAGTIIGISFFDLIPESIELNASLEVHTIMSVVALGFIAYMILDRFIVLHHHDEGDNHHHHKAGLGVISLSIHSLIDGMAIGFAFHVSDTVGLIVTSAVLIHKFSDGINTVNIILKNKGDRQKAMKWLVISSIAPVVGIVSTLLFTVKDSVLGLILAIFAGFFLYIGASDLLPESHHNHPTIWTTLATIFGMILIFIVIQVVHI